MSKEITRREFLKLSAFFTLTRVLKPLDLESAGLVPAKEYLSEIINKVTPLSFDKHGNLTLARAQEKLKLLPTSFGQENKELVERVDLLIVHYDGYKSVLDSGQVRTAQHTLWGLDGNDPDDDEVGASVNWCVDAFPINTNGSEKSGFGILQTQLASGVDKRPFKGRHVYIAGEDKDGQPMDETRFKTVTRFKEAGVVSNLMTLVESAFTAHDALDKLSVSFEQVGTEFDRGFPDANQPSPQQLANALSLTLACISEYNLSPWDVIGHHEIQEKSDPGYLYMGTLRVLLGLSALEGLIGDSQIFGSDYARDYFRKVAEVVKSFDRYKKYTEWEEMVGINGIIESLGQPKNKRILSRPHSDLKIK